MNRLWLLALFMLQACSFGSRPSTDGSFSRLFPKTPLSNDLCLHDQDCVVSDLTDGNCCPEPCDPPANLFHRDRLSKLKAHIQQICEPDTFECTVAECVEPTVRYEGRCIEKRCVRIEVPLQPSTP